MPENSKKPNNLGTSLGKAKLSTQTDRGEESQGEQGQQSRRPSYASYSGSNQGSAPRAEYKNYAPRPYAPRPYQDRQDRSAQGGHAKPVIAPDSSEFKTFHSSEESLNFGDRDQFVAGPNAVSALLDERSQQVHRIVILKDSKNPKLYQLQQKAEKLKIHCQQLPQNKLDSYTQNNQGVIAFCHQRNLDNWTEVKDDLISREKALIFVAVGIEDPRNLGAIIRSAHGLDVDAILLPNKGGCGLTSTVAKVAAGALEKAVLCKPRNLEQEVADLKAAGFQIVALDHPGTHSIYDATFTAKTVLITGGEDQGIPPYLHKQCDQILEIPMRADAHSFNTSVALSIGLYEFRRQFKI
jgi:23S rRNA (guanosine2251-2'-O)-methyltransferase